MRDTIAIILFAVIGAPILVVCGAGVAQFLVGTWLSVFPEPQYHITCYSPDLAITYMSIEPVTLPNEYGVWKFASGKGAYIQQSGDTCITQEVVEMPTHNIPE